MAQQSQTWREYYTTAVEAEAVRRGLNTKAGKDQVNLELWESMDVELELAGLEIETFDFDQPFVPLSQIVGEAIK